MKKVWIASIFATLMLMIPITNVVSANEIEDCNCKPTISDLQVVRVERLLSRLESRINFILFKYGHIPEVVEKCEEILVVINSNDFKEIFCDFLGILIVFFVVMAEILPYGLWVIISGPGMILAAFWVIFCMEFPP